MAITFSKSDASPTDRVVLSINSSDYSVNPDYNTTIIIQDWDSLNSLQKLAIRTQLEASGWIEV